MNKNNYIILEKKYDSLSSSLSSSMIQSSAKLKLNWLQNTLQSRSNFDWNWNFRTEVIRLWSDIFTSCKCQLHHFGIQFGSGVVIALSNVGIVFRVKWNNHSRTVSSSPEVWSLIFSRSDSTPQHWSCHYEEFNTYHAPNTGRVSSKLKCNLFETGEDKSWFFIFYFSYL